MNKRTLIGTLSAAFVSAALLAGPSLAADDVPDATAPKPPRKVSLPRHYEPTPAEQKLIDEANACLARADVLMNQQHEPAKAVDEVRKAIALRNRAVASFVTRPEAGAQPVDARAGTFADTVESVGAMGTLLEIKSSGGQQAAEDHDYQLHRRKIVKDTTESSKKLRDEQQDVTQELTQMANAAAGGGDKPPTNQPPKAQPAKAGAANPNGQQNPGQQNPTGEQTPAQQAKAGQQNPGDPKNPQQQNPDGQQTASAQNPDQKNPAGQQTASAQNPAGEQNPADPKNPGDPKNPAGQQNQGAQQTAAGQKPDGQQNASGQQTAAGQTADPKNQAGQQTASGNPAGQQDPTKTPAGQTATGQNNAAKSDQTAQGQAGATAAHQDQIANALNHLATALAGAAAPGDANDKAADAFRDAAAQAQATANRIRKGDLAGAATASKQTERAIHDAMQQAGMAGNESIAKAIENLQQKVADLQADQQNVLDQAQHAGDGPGGAKASAQTKTERATALAAGQAKLKPRLDELQRSIEDLAQNTGGGDQAARAPENAARAELAAAAAAMGKARPQQKAINATVKLAQGDADGAAQAMANVQSALNAARERVAAADRALQSNDQARMENTLHDVQQLAAEAKRLEQSAMAAAGNGGGKTPAPDDHHAEAGQPNNPSGKPAPSEANKTASGAPLSEGWSELLSKNTADLNAAAAREAARLTQVDPDTAKALAAISQQAPDFDRDYKRSVDQVRDLRASLEKLAVSIQHQIGADAEKKSLRDYRKDEIPSAYRKAVAAYYEELSKEEKK